jgi:hypothetical protein
MAQGALCASCLLCTHELDGADGRHGVVGESGEVDDEAVGLRRRGAATALRQGTLQRVDLVEGGRGGQGRGEEGVGGSMWGGFCSVVSWGPLSWWCDLGVCVCAYQASHGAVGVGVVHVGGAEVDQRTTSLVLTPSTQQQPRENQHCQHHMRCPQEESSE